MQVLRAQIGAKRETATVSYGILDAWWQLDSSCHKSLPVNFCKIILYDVSVKFFTGSDQLAAMSSMRWTVLVACFQDSNKDGKKYSDFVVYGMLSFNGTTTFYQDNMFFCSSAERNSLNKQIFAVSSWCQMKKPDWLFCLGYQKTPSIYHVNCHGQFLSPFWYDCEYFPW